LGHSPYEDAVMYPYSLGAGELSKDDIKGIQHIYGVPRTTTQVESSSTTISFDEEDDRPIWDKRPLVPKTEVPDRCSMSYDAIATLKKELFIFKGKYFWRPESSDTNAVETHLYWPGLPSNLTHVDAVYENDNGKILFFINQKVYIFEWRELEVQIPFMRLGLDKEITKVDMVFKWPYNKMVYLFAGDYYWRYDEKVNAVLRNSRKLTRRAFKDVYDMDTVYTEDKKTYFFKGIYFYEFDDRIMRLDRMKPKVSAYKFMQCEGLPEEPIFENRFGGELDRAIDEGDKKDEIPDDNDNPEKVDFEATTVETVTKEPDSKEPDSKEPDSAVNLEILITVILVSLIVSQYSSTVILT
jgi:hypothetical protein